MRPDERPKLLGHRERDHEVGTWQQA